MRPTLYILQNCPYCHRVLNALDHLNIEVDVVEIGQHPDVRARLARQRGRATVPVLGIPTEDGERLMGESLDIIAWLESHAPRLRRAS